MCKIYDHDLVHGVQTKLEINVTKSCTQETSEFSFQWHLSFKYNLENNTFKLSSLLDWLNRRFRFNFFFTQSQTKEHRTESDWRQSIIILGGAKTTDNSISPCLGLVFPVDFTSILPFPSLSPLFPNWYSWPMQRCIRNTKCGNGMRTF